MLKKPPSEKTAHRDDARCAGVDNHQLRQIDSVIDLSFIPDRVVGRYCLDNGRPPLDPILMFTALFLGYLFGALTTAIGARDRSEYRLLLISAYETDQSALRCLGGIGDPPRPDR
jgi:hypothetical protein